MKVRIVRGIVSRDWAYQVGEVVDLDDALARAWCAGPDPIAVRDDVVETATNAPVETASRRPRRRP